MIPYKENQETTCSGAFKPAGGGKVSSGISSEGSATLV